jgi:hypothetical protein
MIPNILKLITPGYLLEVVRYWALAQLFYLFCKARAQKWLKHNLSSNVSQARQNRSPKYEAQARPDPTKIWHDPLLVSTLCVLDHI